MRILHKHTSRTISRYSIISLLLTIFFMATTVCQEDNQNNFKNIERSMKQQEQKKYKNIIFDLGGVLTNMTEKKMLSIVFHALSPAQVLRVFAQTPSDAQSKLTKGLLSREQYAQQASSDPVVQKKILDCFAQSGEEIKPLTDGVTLLNKVKSLGYNVYILSNTIDVHFTKVATFDFMKNVDGSIASYKVHHEKPEKEIYQTLLSHYSLKAEECFFIDDRESNIAAAKECGIDGVVYDQHERVVEELKKQGVLDE